MSGENADDLIKRINNEMDLLINDMSVPKNVRNSITEAKEKLNSNDEYSVRVSAATYNIDSVSNDVNLQQQARTRLWNILSLLESIKN
ncbi:MAG: UPF0147 family protein [Candidatus Marsarchaeota archaeon]|nr:UPF0147 family protein [Candidatus Marsarchaeota archaeon]MCL5105949.1 UPF0147 family protein [Candidatus Marsarchaeota archaeon]